MSGTDTFSEQGCIKHVSIAENSDNTKIMFIVQHFQEILSVTYEKKQENSCNKKKCFYE